MTTRRNSNSGPSGQLGRGPSTPGAEFSSGAFSLIPGGKVAGAEPGAGAPGGAGQAYNEDMLLVAAHDRGQMEPVTFKIQEQYLAWGRLITESRRFPMLRTRSDIARLGWQRVVAWLTGISGDTAERSVMHQIALMNEKVAWERRGLDYVKFIEDYAPIIQEQLALPHGRLHAARVLRGMRKHIAEMEPSFYTSLFEKMFNDRFGAFEQAGLVLIEVGEEDTEGESAGEGLREEGARETDMHGGSADMEEMMREIEDMIARGQQ